MWVSLKNCQIDKTYYDSQWRRMQLIKSRVNENTKGSNGNNNLWAETKEKLQERRAGVEVLGYLSLEEPLLSRDRKEKDQLMQHEGWWHIKTKVL
jgi:hypothetical protein